MKTETDRTTQTPDEILNELRALVIEAEKIVGQTPAGSCSCDATLEALRERLEAAQERLAAVYAETKRKVTAGVRKADQTVRDHPYESIAIAVGVGLLAGVLMRRRSASSAC